MYTIKQTTSIARDIIARQRRKRGTIEGKKCVIGWRREERVQREKKRRRDWWEFTLSIPDLPGVRIPPPPAFLTFMNEILR